MVLGKFVEEEIKEVKSSGLENSNYRERIGKILDTYSTFPAGDRNIEKQLEQYSEELKDKEVSKEEYISKLEDILGSESSFF